MTLLDLTVATYASAAHEKEQLPRDNGAEVAFAGRSNVGKSSAINAITRQKSLARTSKTPGRTRQIIFFDLDTEHRLVDLPGYGYANVPIKLRKHWKLFISDYLTERVCLKALIVPVDIRRLLMPADVNLLHFCHELGLPVHVLLTKADKLTRNKAAHALKKVYADLDGAPRTTVQLFSAEKKDGVAQARKIIIDFLSVAGRADRL